VLIFFFAFFDLALQFVDLELLLLTQFEGAQRLA
jgi:hypothetical protein